MPRYYIDKCWMDGNKEFGATVSYESGPYNNMFFKTRKEAQAYANEHSFMLSENEVFEIVDADLED